MSNLTKSIPADERKNAEKSVLAFLHSVCGSKPGKTGSFRFLLFPDAVYQQILQNDERAKSKPHKKYVLFQYNHHLFHFHYGSCSFHGEEKQRAEGF